MKVRNFKYFIGVFFIGTFSLSLAQGNPGFLGKKIAVGYNAQFSVIQPVLDFNFNSIINHDFYVEMANTKYSSVSAHVTFGKALVSQTKAENIFQDMTISGDDYNIHFLVNGGNAKMAMFGVGAKYSVYYSNKTISSPVGLSQYVRLDAFFSRPVENNLSYEVGYYNSSSLSESQIKYAEKNIDKSFEAKSSTCLSIGYGVETKLIITRSVFVRLNGEFNLSSRLLAGSTSYSSSDYNLSVSDDLNETAKDITKYRNMILVGFGVGMLL